MVGDCLLDRNITITAAERRTGKLNKSRLVSLKRFLLSSFLKKYIDECTCWLFHWTFCFVSSVLTPLPLVVSFCWRLRRSWRSSRQKLEASSFSLRSLVKRYWNKEMYTTTFWRKRFQKLCKETLKFGIGLRKNTPPVYLKDMGPFCGADLLSHRLLDFPSGGGRGGWMGGDGGGGVCAVTTGLALIGGSSAVTCAGLEDT